MSLADGTRLGPYEILGPLGAGGMGEVYRAEDTRLGRSVAIKVLPEAVAGNERLQQRFDREARALAGLSHPNICTLHDVGEESGVRFLVMELLEGTTLADRMAKGPLPFDQVVRIGIDLAAALDAAHRRGVVHRDVKPGNVMLTGDGVKLLDFGLAKDPMGTLDEAPDADAPTATAHAPITREGTVVGTLNYMAPEQLEGRRRVDARCDVFALGAILYEMTSGARAFHGESQAGLIAAILTSEPTPRLGDLDPEPPAAFTRAIERCLAKDPERRWQSARDLMLELEWIAETGGVEEIARPAGNSRGRAERWVWVALVAILLGAVGYLATGPGAPQGTRRPARLTLPLPGGATWTFARVSPDGAMIVMPVRIDGKRSLWLRRLDSAEIRRLPGTDDALFPFWSPDSLHVGFFAEGKLKRIDVRQGAPTALCDAPGPFLMGTWSEDGTILFSVSETPGQDGIHRIAASGGTRERLTLTTEQNGDATALWPSFLPDGRHFLALCDLGPGGAELNPAICVGSLETLRLREVAAVEDAGSRAEYVAPGFLVFTRNRALRAQRFDLESMTLEGESFTLAENLDAAGPVGLDNFSVSQTGTLVFQTTNNLSRLVLKDRNGRDVREFGPPDAYTALRLSPNGDRLAFSVVDLEQDKNDVWVVGLDRDVRTRFTTDEFDNMMPIWSPDGTAIVYSSARDEPPFMHVKPLSGGEERVLLPSRGTLQAAGDWSPRGDRLAYSDRDPETGWDIWILAADGTSEPAPFARTRFDEAVPAFSPDGSWIAYASDESGTFEVYVRRSEGGGEKHRVSTAGGYLPRWRADGRELFYLNGDGMLVAAEVDLTGPFRQKGSTNLFSIGTNPNAMMPYDVTANGQRFAVLAEVRNPGGGPTVVLDWPAILPNGGAD